MSFLVVQSPVIPVPYSGKGQIQLIFGPMFSGKTTELIRRCRRYHIANYTCIVVKYARDQRYATDEVATHDEAKLNAITALELEPLREQLKNYEVIGIDEGQFFPDVVEICEELANDKKIVVVAALDGTFQREAFGRILELVPKAEHVIKLTAVCMGCFNEASFTKRKGEEKTIEVIGGTEMYAAVCRDCYAGMNLEKRRPCSPTPQKGNEKKQMLPRESWNVHTPLIFERPKKLDFSESPNTLCKVGILRPGGNNALEDRLASSLGAGDC